VVANGIQALCKVHCFFYLGFGGPGGFGGPNGFGGPGGFGPGGDDDDDDEDDKGGVDDLEGDE
jgi:hypothetical protein